MPYDPGLAQRLAEILEDRPGFQLKKMFGGIGWLLNGNMCAGVYKEWLITRVGEEMGGQIFREQHVKPMDITGRPMKGWMMVAPDGVADDAALHRYVELAIAFVTSLPKKD
jgi:TfoX N-terminal domain